jgi:hypothetical protein
MELGSSTWFCLEMGYPWLSRILPNGIFHGENEENPWIFLGTLFSDIPKRNIISTIQRSKFTQNIKQSLERWVSHIV